MLYKFQEAKLEDINLILNIENGNKKEFLREGFLITNLDYRTLYEKMLKENYQIYLIKNEDNIVSFSIIKKTFKNLVLNDIPLEFFDFYAERDKKDFYKENHLHIEVISFKTNFLKIGLANFHYNNILEKYPQSSLSIITSPNPLLNNFHYLLQKNFNFKNVGIFNSEEYGNLNVLTKKTEN